MNIPGENLLFSSLRTVQSFVSICSGLFQSQSQSTEQQNFRSDSQKSYKDGTSPLSYGSDFYELTKFQTLPIFVSIFPVFFNVFFKLRTGSILQIVQSSFKYH